MLGQNVRPKDKRTHKTMNIRYHILIEFIAFLVMYSCALNPSQNTTTMQLNKLTPEEESVIINKGTERPFTGEYWNNHAQGIYVCKHCNQPLYKSDNKFDSHCGWPSFDQEIAGAVKRIPDKDGVRTEIICAHCGAHLGHVFEGEGFTTKNTRHCVNSISLKFIPDNSKYDTAYFASGCFWGTQYWFDKTKGVISTTVGYSGGHFDNPTYEDVCSGETGHAETIQVVYNPIDVSYSELVKLFFETHDQSQINRQGPDIGEQYRSGIFYVTEEQKIIANMMIDTLKEKGYGVATKLEKFDRFWNAEQYHQHYYDKKHGKPYCHVYQKKF